MHIVAVRKGKEERHTQYGQGGSAGKAVADHSAPGLGPKGVVRGGLGPGAGGEPEDRVPGPGGAPGGRISPDSEGCEGGAGRR